MKCYQTSTLFMLAWSNASSPRVRPGGKVASTHASTPGVQRDGYVASPLDSGRGVHTVRMAR